MTDVLQQDGLFDAYVAKYHDDMPTRTRAW